MARYFTVKSQGYIEDFTWSDEPMIPSLDVPDHTPTWTGLLDLNEDPIMRAPRPIGFGRDEDW